MVNKTRLFLRTEEERPEWLQGEGWGEREEGKGKGESSKKERAPYNTRGVFSLSAGYIAFKKRPIFCSAREFRKEAWGLFKDLSPRPTIAGLYETYLPCLVRVFSGHQLALCCKASLLNL